MQFMTTSNDQDFFDWVWCKTPSHPNPAFSAFQSTPAVSDSDVGKWIPVTGELVAIGEVTTIECLFSGHEGSTSFMMVDDLYLECA